MFIYTKDNMEERCVVMKKIAKNYYKTTRFLFLYKSFLFRFVTFTTDSEELQDQIIVNALNIKNRKKRITYIYDSACKIIDDYNAFENICGFKNCQCYLNRNTKYKYGCCRLCKYKSDTGCPTSNLACKLFNCSEVCSRRKVIKYEDLKILKVLSIRQRFVVKSDYFSLREDVLKDLYCYTLTFAIIRIILRLFKNIIVRDKKTYE